MGKQINKDLETLQYHIIVLYCIAFICLGHIMVGSDFLLFNILGVIVTIIGMVAGIAIMLDNLSKILKNK